MRCTAIPQFRSRRGEWNHPKNGDWEWVVGRVPSRGDTDAASSYAGSGDPATTLRDLPQPHPQGEPLDSCQSARLSCWEGPFVALEPSSTAVSRFNHGQRACVPPGWLKTGARDDAGPRSPSGEEAEVWVRIAAGDAAGAATHPSCVCFGGGPGSWA